VSTTAKLCVPAGAPVQASAGDVLAPLQVLAVGIVLPSANAVLVSVSDAPGAPSGFAASTAFVVSLLQPVSTSPMTIHFMARA
jgi:hypothetical protein